MRKRLIAANWKMNGSLERNADLLGSLVNSLADMQDPEVLLCVPSPYFQQASSVLGGTSLRWGGQNMNEHEAGAYTGEVSASMLRDFGCTHVLVGHSERRHFYGESDDLIEQKFKLALKSGLIPMLCVGETAINTERGVLQATIDRQLDAVLGHIADGGEEQFVVCYEPLWAIGTGKVASATVVQAVHAYIRAKLAFFNDSIAQRTRILYGGSVKPSNVEGLLAQPDVDGCLIGGASLVADDFAEICRLAQKPVKS